mmetsp:Transcript_36591/g.85144  ORF Transcript_36591/g.85144 Transcript_36591/m.85144 type:complete len:128 (+) Transcript_36591:91-474(+)
MACKDAVKQSGSDWERLISSASTCAEGAHSDKDSDSEGEWEAAGNDAEAEADALLSVLLAVTVLGVACLVWSRLPVVVSCVLLVFLVLEIACYASAPVIPAAASSCLLAAALPCGCAVVLACQTPQL